MEEADLSSAALPNTPARASAAQQAALVSDLPRALARCPALRYIDLSGSHYSVSDQLLAGLAAACGGLRELSLNYCGRLTEAGLEVSAASSPLCGTRNSHFVIT